jgi:hypothetical protein
MPFVELKPGPGARTSGTGVRLSKSDKFGLTVSFSGRALDAVGDSGLKVLADLDPAFPRLRILRSPEGPFQMVHSPGRSKAGADAVPTMLRIPPRDDFGASEFRALDCVWEPVLSDVSIPGEPPGVLGIDIELPREMRLTQSVQPVGQPSTSMGPRPNPVTVAGTRVRERA